MTIMSFHCSCHFHAVQGYNRSPRREKLLNARASILSNERSKKATSSMTLYMHFIRIALFAEQGNHAADHSMRRQSRVNFIEHTSLAIRRV
jgi:hypothetical protein